MTGATGPWIDSSPKRTLEQHLAGRSCELFTLDYNLLLYDVTDTYFEGQPAIKPLGLRAYSWDHRLDCT